MKNICNIIMIIFVSICICGCKSTQNRDVYRDINNINIEIVSTSELESGIYYTLDVINDSKELIKYVEIMLGYTITKEAKKDGMIGPIMFQGETVDNPIDLKQGEKKTFTVHVPTPLLKQDKINMDNIQILIQGYFSEIKIENRFQKSGDIGLINENDKQ